MALRFILPLFGLPALVVWTLSCADQPPTATEERSEMSPAGQQVDQVRNGFSATSLAQVARPGFIDFDPPCLFARTLPLQDAPYMNPATRAHFARGHGAVLDQCSGFSVSGFSPPNFLAWNCEATNSDGTRPALPAEIHFLSRVSEVSIMVGSAANAGSNARLIAFNSAFEQVDAANVTLAANLKTLAVEASEIRFVRLTGPCILVADDLRVRR
jgi:hypothetical protein